MLRLVLDYDTHIYDIYLRTRQIILESEGQIKVTYTKKRKFNTSQERALRVAKR